MPEASVATGLSISTIRRLINGGKLPARYERGEKGQHKYFIRRADLAGLAELGKGTGPELRAGAARSGASGHHGVQEHPAAQRNGVHVRQVAQAGGDHGAQGEPPAPGKGVHGDQEDQRGDAPGAPGALGDQTGAMGGAHGVQPAETPGDHGSLEEYAAQFELAVVRERLQGAQEAVRLHAERVRAQTKDIGFLQAQLDQSRKAEEQLRVLLARLTAALPSPEEPRVLQARNVTPEPEKVRWWWPWGKR